MACSGTIDTPTEEFPPRSGNAAADDDDDAESNTTPRPTPSPSPSPTATNNPPAAPPAASGEDEPADEPPANDPPPAASGGLTFANDIQPIFNADCGPCHVTNGIVHNIGSDDLEEAFGDAIDFEEAVISEIEAGEMPPACGGGAPGSGGSCVSEEDFEAIQDWYAAGAPE